MLIKVTLSVMEVHNILLAHIHEKFKAHAGRGQILDVRRAGDACAFEATVEAVPEPRDER